MLQYIIRGSNAQEIINTATSALNYGCRWIRLNLRELAPTEIDTTIKTLQAKCNYIEAYLSIENDVKNVARLKVAGIHLGDDSNISAVDTRKQLGEEPIIGITVSEATEIPFIPRAAIDYIAVASDNLNICRKVVEQMHAIGLEEPVVAPYSYATSLKTLMATGINGIAVQHSNTSAIELPKLLKELYDIMEKRLEDI
ncbi:MAG: thiamine phosphate synthase [Muribaculaceae bacterium]|nr:thiamine phosphate synthase [Muribaculaceae bacterium]